jgi:hypothetical protein
MNKDSDEIDKRIKTITHRLSLFFVESDDVIVSTEKNQKLLRTLILHHKPYLVYIQSFDELELSPTMISELIIFVLKQNCYFQSELESILFKPKDIDKVYPIIFEHYKSQIPS